MDWQTLINLGAGTVLAIVGNLYREAKNESRDNASAITALALKVAEDCVTHSDLSRIENTLIRIEHKLDSKADK